LASSIFCFIDFSLVLARHYLSSFCASCNWSSLLEPLLFDFVLPSKSFDPEVLLGHGYIGREDKFPLITSSSFI
jgi:hypothetical protein